MASLKDTKIDSYNALKDREIFYTKDFAQFLNVKPETINKNYVRTGLIESSGKVGRRLTFTKE